MKINHQQIYKELVNGLKNVIVIVLLSCGALGVMAYSDPTATPPNGDVAAPINVSSASQTKSGNFTVLGVLIAGGVHSLTDVNVDGKVMTGTLAVTGGAPAVGKVLTSDASGNATWQAVPGGSGSSCSTDATCLNTSSATQTKAGAIGVTDIITNNVYTTNAQVNGTANVVGTVFSGNSQVNNALVVKGSITTQNMQINNAMVLPNGAGKGKVLMSDATGNANWQNNAVNLQVAAADLDASKPFTYAAAIRFDNPQEYIGYSLTNASRYCRTQGYTTGFITEWNPNAVLTVACIH